MKELSKVKKRKIFSLLRGFRKKYLLGRYNELDESATRLMINDFLSNILGFASLDEIKTEYMIRGTYADYVVQIKGKQFFIVEVKAMPIELSEKHLRQVVHYAADEGIEWALLTNGKKFNFYKIIFEKPISCRQVFSIDLSDEKQLKSAMECFQYLSKWLVPYKGLEKLWHRVSALDPNNLSRMLYCDSIVNFLRRELKRVYKNQFSRDEVVLALTRVAEEKIECEEPLKKRRLRRARKNKVVIMKKELISQAVNVV